MKNAYKVVIGRFEGKSHLEDLGADGSIILRGILKKFVVTVWTG
jgi:hypothetical protein